MYLANLGSQKKNNLSASGAVVKRCSHTNSYVQSDFNGPHFLALSSFPPFCQSCHSLSQQREGEGESMLCQLSRVTSAFTLFWV